MIKLIIQHTSRQNTLDIKALDASTLFIKAPRGCSTKEIENVLTHQQEKIRQMLSKTSDRYTSKDYQNGCSVLYLGRSITLQFVDLAGNKWRFLDNENTLHIEQKMQAEIELVLKGFYKARSIILRNRCLELAKQNGFTPTRISLRWTTSRWGSCSTKGSISLSIALIMAPGEIQDYIILHELCHLVHPNHSREFHTLLNKLDTKCKEHLEWLRQNGWELRVWPQQEKHV